MFGFGRGNIPPDETIDWVFDAARWWLASFGGFDANAAGARVLTPSEEDFPVDPELEAEELAEEYLAFSIEHAHLGDMHFSAVADESPNIADALRGMPHHMTAMSGAVAEDATIGEGEALTIPYDVRQVDDPVGLVATFARGMSHYRLFEAPAELPFDNHDDSEDREYYVDVGAVFLGFGIFLANSAFRFQQVTEGSMIGWGASRSGALSEIDLAYVIALYTCLFELSHDELLPHLRPNPRGFLKSARKHILKKRADSLQQLRSIPSTSGGPYR